MKFKWSFTYFVVVGFVVGIAIERALFIESIQTKAHTTLDYSGPLSLLRNISNSWNSTEFNATL